MPVPERSSDYRDGYPLSDAIREAYSDGLSDGQSWGGSARNTDDRDYAAARADRLEAEVERLREQVAEYRREVDRHAATADALAAKVERLRKVIADLYERQHDYPTDLSLMRDEKEWRAAFQRARDALNPSP